MHHSKARRNPLAPFRGSFIDNQNCRRTGSPGIGAFIGIRFSLFVRARECLSSDATIGVAKRRARAHRTTQITFSSFLSPRNWEFRVHETTNLCAVEVGADQPWRGRDGLPNI